VYKGNIQCFELIHRGAISRS